MLVAAAAVCPAQVQEPPEEDVQTERQIEYTLNPIQADKELTVGKYYAKKGSNKAAARRFEEALKWNPGLGEAWLRLGDVRLKLKDEKGARAAYERYLEAEPAGKEVKNVRKRLDGLPR